MFSVKIYQPQVRYTDKAFNAKNLSLNVVLYVLKEPLSFLFIYFFARYHKIYLYKILPDI